MPRLRDHPRAQHGAQLGRAGHEEPGPVPVRPRQYLRIQVRPSPGSLAGSGRATHPLPAMRFLETHTRLSTRGPPSGLDPISSPLPLARQGTSMTCKGAFFRTPASFETDAFATTCIAQSGHHTLRPQLRARPNMAKAAASSCRSLSAQPSLKFFPQLKLPSTTPPLLGVQLQQTRIRNHPASCSSSPDRSAEPLVMSSSIFRWTSPMRAISALRSASVVFGSLIFVLIASSSACGDVVD